MTEAQRRAWNQDATGFTLYDPTLTIVDSSTPGVVGTNVTDIPMFYDACASEFEHIKRNPRSTVTARKLHTSRVWEMTFANIDGFIRVDWRVLYVVPTNCAATMTRLLSVVRSVSEALEGDDPPAPAATVVRAAHRSASSPQLRAV